MARDSMQWVGALLLGFLAVDAIVVVGLSAPPSLEIRPTSAAAPGPAAEPPARTWALCQTTWAGQPVNPALVAVTYLDAGADDGITPEEIRGWFAALPPGAVDVYLLEDAQGGRRVALQIGRDKWSEWSALTGELFGEAVCDRLRAELVARGVGRPGPPPAGESPSRYDFEFIYLRRPHLYRSIAWAGELDYALAPHRFPALIDWLRGGTS
jgi:hypothetical protein